MSKYCLINDEQNYWEMKLGEGDLSITNEYEPKTNGIMKKITVIYQYLCVYICI